MHKDSWDYCSILPDHTRTLKKCQDNHPCGYHGYSYLWCYVDNGHFWDWDYCSIIEDNSLTQFTYEDDECENYCDIHTDRSEYTGITTK